MKNVLYFRELNEIGGVETMFYCLARKYQNNDITVYYSSGDQKQINRLAQFVRVKKYKPGEIIKCEKAFFNYNTEIIDNVEAAEYYQIIHADYKSLNKIFRYTPSVHPKINKYIGVSKFVCKTFEEMTGISAECCYNPIIVDKPKKVLNLISATRLTPEKGKNRMIRFAEMLDEAGIPYLWTVFTNDTNAIQNPNVVYMKPRLDGIIDYIANADYLVQLSDSEAYSYSIIEALTVGTPVIVTDLPVLKEMGVNEKNSFVLDFDMKNVPIDAIYKGLAPFEYKPNPDGWAKLLAKGKSTYKEDMKTMVTVKARQDYFDLQMQKLIKKTDEPYQVTKARADQLDGMGLAEIVDDNGVNE